MSKEFRVGLLGVASIVIFILGFSFLKRSTLLNPSNIYYAEYKETYGLQPDDPVYINGVQIGKVGDIELSKEQHRRVKVTLIIDNGEEIPVNSIANLFSEDFLGEKSIKILLKDTTAMYPVGATLRTELEKDMLAGLSDQFTPITEKLEAMVPEIQQLLEKLNATFNEDLTKDIQGTLKNLESLTATLNYQLSNENGEIKQMFGNLNEFTGNLNDQNDTINEILSNFSQLSSELEDAEIKELITDANTAINELNEVLTAVNEGDGAIAAMLHDEEFKEELTDITININKLLEDFKANPQRYVSFSLFGSKDKTEKEEKREKKKKAKQP